MEDYGDSILIPRQPETCRPLTAPPAPRFATILSDPIPLIWRECRQGMGVYLFTGRGPWLMVWRHRDSNCDERGGCALMTGG